MDSRLIFEGVGVAITTPFSSDEIDFEAFSDHIEYLIKNNAQALIVNGTTGESPTLSMKEAKLLIEAAVTKVAGRIPVIAGTGTNATQSTVEMSKFAENVGADGIMLITPYYNKTNQKGLYQHFIKVADSTNLPVVLYNVPSRTAMTIEAETVYALSKHPNIIALKDATGNLEYTKQLLELTGDENFSLYSGNDDNMHRFCSIGGKGLISVVGNVIPGEMQDIYGSIKEHKPDSEAKFQQLMPLIEAAQVDVNPMPIKAMTSALGFGLNEFRLPLVPLEGAALGHALRTLKNYKEGIVL
ncbi:4-hydroxy-tetrahydrodipicolinate synthase [Salinicoccus siamensis]|uniref:4-hydroxy-tetrahydrodipicolinate synthase n=1 Tax=Salinicoccus siamensis TaxID=381830 RepID=A0ABV5Z2V2_9STAP